MLISIPSVEAICICGGSVRSGSSRWKRRCVSEWRKYCCARTWLKEQTAATILKKGSLASAFLSSSVEMLLSAFCSTCSDMRIERKSESTTGAVSC